MIIEGQLLLDTYAIIDGSTQRVRMSDVHEPAASPQQQLVLVPIYYSDLVQLKSEPITLFADSTTTAG